MMILAMAGLLAVAVMAFRALERDVDGYRAADAPALHWSAAQVEVELAKFVATLSRYVVGDPSVTQRDVNARFDILWSRTSDFRSGALGEALRTHDADVGAIPVLLSRMQTSEAAILNIDRDNRAENMKLLQEFSEVHTLLRRMVVVVLNAEQQRYISVRNSLQAGSELTFMVWVAAVVLAALIVGIMLIETRRYQRMVLETEELAEQALAADKAKSRFLTMMSHELRTPMNGVLGLIALAKQSGLTDAQTRLIEQAERSGVHMTNLLGDILDFSDLQTERLELDNATFQTRDLGSAVNDLIEVSAKRNALELAVDYAPDLPDWVVGDFARLRQALAHFCSYFIEIVGVDDLRLKLSHNEGTLYCEIEMDAAGSDRPGWQPEAVFGREVEAYGDFASDSLGPTIARGLVNLMGGQVEIARPVPRRARLVVSVPAEAVETVKDCIRIETSSDTTKLLIRNTIESGAESSAWRVWDPKLDRARVAAVLVEATLVTSAQDLPTRLRKLHPGARIICVGKPDRISEFDGVCPLPLDERTLNALLMLDRDDAAFAQA